MHAKLVKQYSVFLPNRPGSLNRVTKLFAESSTNILGLSSDVRDDAGVVRIAVDADQDVSPILTNAGFPVIETTLISVELIDRPGELHNLTEALARANINITTVYGTSVGEQPSRVLLAIDDTKKARKILEELPDY